jgi:hypothetical protein
MTWLSFYICFRVWIGRLVVGLVNFYIFVYFNFFYFFGNFYHIFLFHFFL